MMLQFNFSKVCKCDIVIVIMTGTDQLTFISIFLPNYFQLVINIQHLKQFKLTSFGQFKSLTIHKKLTSVSLQNI